MASDSEQQLDTPVEQSGDQKTADHVGKALGSVADAGKHGVAEHREGDHEGGSHSPLSAEHLIGHVKDSDHFVFPRMFHPSTDGKVFVPQVRESTEPVIEVKTGFGPIDQLIEPFDLRLTKFMVLELIAALILVVIFVPLARQARGGGRPVGRLWNLFEAMVVFIRDQVARPTIGKHEGDKFSPFLLTLFFFVLTCNLLGMLPWAGSPTGAIGTTGALALITYCTVVLAGSVKLGPIGYWVAQVPHMDLSPGLSLVLKPMIFVIEVLGNWIKHFVLAVRLLANMVGGHVVLATLIAFIGATGGTMAFFGVMPASVLAAVALGLLELFVAFLQAYIFVFLAGLFIGMAVHPH